MSERETYRKVESIFADFNKSIASMEKSESLDKCDDYSELSKQYATLNDGQVIEICFWHESDMYLYDLSIDKEKFDAAYDTSFEDYMKGMGIYTENVEEESGTKWKYCGDQQAEEKGFHRLQFFMEDWG